MQVHATRSSRPSRLRNPKTLQEKEREYIEEVLLFTQGNKTKAAEILGINRKTLREKLK